MSFTHNFSANTGYLWKELSFIDRLAIAKKYGFESLEFHDEPHYENLSELQSILSKLELPVNGMNVRMGETFGCAALSEYNEKYLNDIFNLLKNLKPYILTKLCIGKLNSNNSNRTGM